MALECLFSSELDLEGEWQKQAETLATLFAKELGLSKEEYAASFPKFDLQPEVFKGRFDIPVVVETRIPVERQCELAGIRYFLGDLEVVDWVYDPKGYKTPGKPYVVWLQDGKKNIKRAVKDVRKELAEDERGGTVFDGIALFLAHPEILENHSIDLAGTHVGGGGAPYLRLGHVGPGLGSFWTHNAGPEFGSVSCGRS